MEGQDVLHSEKLFGWFASKGFAHGSGSWALFASAEHSASVIEDGENGKGGIGMI